MVIVHDFLYVYQWVIFGKWFVKLPPILIDDLHRGQLSTMKRVVDCNPMCC